MGYKVFTVCYGEKKQEEVNGVVKLIDDRTVENDYLKFSINPNGTLNMLSKKNNVSYEGVSIVDGNIKLGDKGEEYKFSIDINFESNVDINRELSVYIYNESLELDNNKIESRVNEHDVKHGEDRLIQLCNEDKFINDKFKIKAPDKQGVYMVDGYVTYNPYDKETNVIQLKNMYIKVVD